jgi:arginyl-tRNA synthetase
MISILSQAKQDIASMIKKASGLEIDLKTITFPPNPRLADFSFPCFGLAKKLNRSPGETAAEIYKKLEPLGLVERVQVAGAYLNFFLKRADFAIGAIQEITTAKKKYGQSVAFKGERVMMEFVSPNNNKPLHLGHLRNAFLGESVSRLLESQGAKVIRACLFNDRGLHIAKSMIAYERWGRGKTPKSAKVKGDKFIGDLYVEFEKKAKTNPKLLEEAEKMVQLWEQGDKKTLALWKKLSNWALAGFKQSFKRLKVKFVVSYFESRLWQKGKEMVGTGLKKEIFKKDETGNVVADLSAFNLPPKVMLRADGTAIYSTTDLYLGKEKFEKQKLTRAVWCVGSEQDLYLKQLFAIYQLFGFPWFGKCRHLSYGLVFLPEGKMKSREGKVVEADDLMDELRALVTEEIKARHELSITETKKRAELIAQAALRFYLLAVAPQTIVHFNPESSIVFTGHTGPYLLYTYARIASILRKAGNAPHPPLKIRGGEGGVMITDLEWLLIFTLARFPEVVRESAIQYDPSHLAQYLYDLTKTFSDFYETVPVLKASSEMRAARLALLSAMREVLGEGLRLLTIKPVEKM